MHTPTLRLLSLLDQWTNPTARIWRYFFDEGKDEIQVAADRGIEVYSRAPGRSRRYQYSHDSEAETPTGKPASIFENEDGSLKIRDTGHDLASVENTEHRSFREHLHSFGGEWFWEDLRTPDGTKSGWPRQ